MARRVYGAYRKDDFADPDSFLAQLGMVLERYPDEIIRHVTSPITGIQRRSKFPPTIAEVAEACDNEVARVERIQRLGALRTAPREPRVTQHRANVFVPPYAPQYADMVERAKTGDPREWRFDENRPGIWVALGWVRPSMGGVDAVGQTITPAMVKQQLGISDEEWDKIPDLPETADYWKGLRAPKELED